MKSFVIVAVSLLISNNNCFSQCQNSSNYGDVEICLPDIVGMIEGYSNPKIKEWVNFFQTPVNDVLGFYLPNELYHNFDPSRSMDLAEFIEVFGLKQFRDAPANHDNLKMVAEKVTQTFDKETWARIQENLDEFSSKIGVYVGRPVLVETYSPSKNIKSAVCLAKSSGPEQNNDIQVMINNSILVKDRIIFVTYFCDYKNFKSIKEAKASNDYSTMLFVDENN